MTTFRSLYEALSVQQFLNRLIDDLVVYRKSALVLLPGGVAPADIWEIVRGELDRRQCDLHEIPLPELDEHPLTALGHYFGMSRPQNPAPRTLEAFFERARTDDLLPDILYLEALDRLPAPALADWLMFIRGWAQFHHGMTQTGRKRTALCLLIPAALVIHQLPEGHVPLAMHWWWGFPSALETLVLCRHELAQEDDQCLARWREHMLASLAAGDAAFIEYLWSDIDLCHGDIERRARTFADERGWTKAALQEWGADSLLKAPLSYRGRTPGVPPASLQRLWSAGALQWTPEYGLELHTAALACLGIREEFQHRIWRGQMHLIYPMIDYLRLIVCSNLTARYGRDWPVQWRHPEKEKDLVALEHDPYACELPHLVVLLDKFVHKDVRARWYEVIACVVGIRNKLAHYRPIAFADFAQLWSLTETALGAQASSVLQLAG